MTREEFIFKVESTQKPFRRFLSALCCGDMSLADDIAQESYIRAWLSLDKIRDTDKFSSWLYKIGYNSFVNHRRSLRPMIDFEAAASIAADVEADADFRYQELYAALDRLSSSERTAILLYYMEGYAVSDIAVIMEASSTAVRQYLSRGRNHLRGLLD